MNNLNKMIIIILIIIHIVGIKLAKKIKFHYKINNKKLMLNNYQNKENKVKKQCKLVI